jgi:uncharacterized damage-inducible protein DinB
MSPSPQALIRSLDDQRRALLESLDSLSGEELRTRPHPGAWSILEILEHLVVSEAAILQGLPPRAELVDRPRNLSNRIKLLVVMAVLRWRIPVKVPSRRMLPTGQRSLDELRTQWDEHLTWLGAFVAEAGDAASGACFSHPVAGPVTLIQALRMDLLHLRTHQRQIARLRPPA